MGVLGLVALAASAAGGGFPQEKREPLPPVASYGDRIVIERNIPFSREDKPYQKLDLYRPKGKGPFPVVVCYFGGGFVNGSKKRMEREAAFLASRGFGAAAANYVLARPAEGKAGWPQNVYDAKCAVRFLRANASTYDLDPQRFAAMGSSSGSYLAMMVAFTPGRSELEGSGGWNEASSRVQAVVNIAGVCDRRAGLGQGTERLLGKGYGSKPDLRALASPVVHITSGSPPVYTLHGTEDENVVPASARQLDAALRKAGVPHRLHWVEGAGHNPKHLAALASIADWLRSIR